MPPRWLVVSGLVASVVSIEARVEAPARGRGKDARNPSAAVWFTPCRLGEGKSGCHLQLRQWAHGSIVND